MQWLDVLGYEGLYEVSSTGQVRNKRTGLTRTPQVDSQRGHLCVLLYRNNKPVGKQISHLVLEAFVGPRPDGLLALHWDDDPLNNDLTNLRWGTHSENRLDMVRNGNHHNAKKTHCKHGHPFDADNTYITPSNGARQCKACYLNHQAARTQQKHDRKGK